MYNAIVRLHFVHLYSGKFLQYIVSTLFIFLVVCHRHKIWFRFAPSMFDFSLFEIKKNKKKRNS